MITRELKHLRMVTHHYMVEDLNQHHLFSTKETFSITSEASASKVIGNYEEMYLR